MPTVYITAPREAADDLAADLVESEVAACVNRVDCSSTFRWEGDVVTEAEAVLLAKTTDDGYEALKARVEDQHPYDVPCIERFDEDDVLDAFGEWVAESVR
ncbi:divalent-cation tolerance protein CutA [Natronomonas pharaonis DSM 2160]|uniref:Divalent-cation tolerance protein CutA n=1 Tax=Natronomonas pharaonis (strain ATCC 35678 / DSM 2160 / CIP 103997 / JCM 8858 / NBRC 14720 / NCIMB 2260 / Gabara) TaxID=348780 RepID=A0A1U7EWH3_NATPD|nr:divalent-cation tolerance protein CutA [Natronomonas pharaonis]CAI49436.1 divalent-cation tolerance protein CutA [Natronomonas pharaonis DSM 2160]